MLLPELPEKPHQSEFQELGVGLVKSKWRKFVLEEKETQHHPADQTVGPRAKHGQVGENEISRD